jgi:hypothetical protein
MKQHLITAFLCVITLCFFACDRPECANQNPIFENHEPDSKLYKDELVTQLERVDQSKLRYWLKNYNEQDGEESLFFYIQGDGLCAILHLNMNHWNKLEQVRTKKGVGRRGAEFTNLKFSIISDSLSTKFIYSSYDRLID